MTDFKMLLSEFEKHNVKFIIVGGVAAVAHGSARSTSDLDIVYERSKENLKNIVQALAPYKPYLRGAPPGLPFFWDEVMLENGLNFTLSTQLGSIDLLGEILGGGTYENMRNGSVKIEVFGYSCFVLDLPTLLKTKKAAGRPKDLEVLAELEALLDESSGKK